MQYQILRTDKFEDQLRDIIFYIAEDSGDVNITLSYLAKIEKTVEKLLDFPYCGSVPKYSILKKQGYRVLVIENHLIFYKVEEDKKRVILYTIVDGRREYKNLI